MILPTMNGEAVDSTGRPALKTEERKVRVFPCAFLSDLNLQARVAYDLPMVLFTESAVCSCFVPL